MKQNVATCWQQDVVLQWEHEPTGSWLEISEKIHLQFSPQRQRFLPLSDTYFYSFFQL